MPSREHYRRSILKASAIALLGTSGCLSGLSSPDTDGDPPQSPPNTAATDSTANSDAQVDSLSVQDYLLYPLAGTHPHVHRREGTQYVVVRVRSSADAEAVRERLSLTLDSESVSLAGRQPDPWGTETVDVAFAVSKTTTYEGGQILFDGEVIRSLSAVTLERLNNPPVFAVSNPTVSPVSLQADETTDARVLFDVRNTGAGPGTFAASLKGNYVSGANNVTARVEDGEQRRLNVTTPVVGDGDEATVRLDWGTDAWTGSIPVTDASAGHDVPAGEALVVESSHAIEGTMVNIGAEGVARNTAATALVDCVVEVSGTVGGATYTERATRHRLAPDEAWEWTVAFGEQADASSDDSVADLTIETRAAYAE